MRALRRAFSLLGLLAMALWSATEGAGRGIYGKIEYLYLEQVNSNDRYTTLKESQIQNYGLGYQSYLYSPKFLIYTMEGALYIDDTSSKIGDAKSNSNLQGENYKANFDFIKNTPYRFTITREKRYAPYLNTQPDIASYSIQNYDNTGLSGSMSFVPVNISYGIKNNKSTTEDSFANESRKEGEYSLSADKAFDNKAISVQYINRERDYRRESSYYSSYNNWKESSQESSINFSWDILKTLRFYSYGRYMSNDFLGFENRSGNLNLRWQPDRRLSVTLNLNSDNFTSSDSETDNLMGSLSTMYFITQDFTLSQDITMFKTVSGNNEYDSSSASVGTSYRRAINDRLSFSLNGNAGKKIDMNRGTDLNISITNRNQDIYSVGGGVHNNFDTFNARTSLTTSHSTSRSTAGDETKNQYVTLNLSAQLLYNLEYTLRSSYSKENSLFVSGIDGELRRREIDMIILENSLRYWKNVDINGKFSSSIGLRQNERKTKTSEDGSNHDIYTNPYADILFTYRLWRSLSFKSSGNILQDATYDLTNYTGSVSLNYSHRRLNGSLEYLYTKKVGQNTENPEYRTVRFQVSRVF